MLNRSSAAAAGLLLAASMFAPAYAGTQLANAANSAFCTEGANAAYQRPGGFCDQLDDTNSLVKDDGDDGCSITVTMNGSFETPRLLVAGPGPIDPCDPCYNYGFVNDLFPNGLLSDGTERLRVAIC